MDELLDKLNEEQIKPVKDTEGDVLVLAGAGSGKTRVLTSRIAYILREGLASPRQILAITFTNKAAAEMKERVRLICGDVDDMWICTIHSMCVRILRRYPAEAGIKPDFSIYSETERRNIVKKCLKELDYDDEKMLKKARWYIADAKMLGLEPDQYIRKHAHDDRIDDYMRVYERYEEQLKANNSLDFDDLLLYVLRLLRRDGEVREYLSDRFKYILVDEFQDTNSVQYEIIKLLSGVHGNLFCVGDDDQSIYGWRGAEIENILRFDDDFPEAKVYKLERNYRSTNGILQLANAIIKNNAGRRGKTLWTDAADGAKPQYYAARDELSEALFSARTINELVLTGGYRYSDFAVLMRINALTRSFEQEFTKYNIPYKVFGGLKFFERKEIKDVLAYLRLISNPYDNEALTRIINVPRRGIGGKTVEAMEEYAAKNGLSLYDAVLDCDELPLNSGLKSKLSDFGKTIKGLVISSIESPVNAFVRQVIDATGLREGLEDENDLANVDEFVASVDDFSRLNPNATLSEYLSQVTLYLDTDDMDESNYVTLATIHSVKGLEFRAVFIVGLEDGIMPSSRAESEGRGAGGGAQADVRRHNPRRRAAVAHAGGRAQPLRQARPHSDVSLSEGAVRPARHKGRACVRRQPLLRLRLMARRSATAATFMRTGRPAGRWNAAIPARSIPKRTNTPAPQAAPRPRARFRAFLRASLRNSSRAANIRSATKVPPCQVRPRHRGRHTQRRLGHKRGVRRAGDKGAFRFAGAH